MVARCNGGVTMKKNNIRSIRFSDELAELIDRQIGNSFTEKFENLITRCVWELPAREKEATAGRNEQPLLQSSQNPGGTIPENLRIRKDHLPGDGTMGYVTQP